MNVKRRNGNKKRNTFLAACFRIFNAIVVQNPVVDPFGSSACLHFEFPQLAAAWDFGKKAQIPIGFSVNDPAVVGRRTSIASLAALGFAANTGAAPLSTAAVFAAKAPIDHFVAAGTDWRTAVFVNVNVFWIFKIPFVGGVKGNDGVDIPPMKQFICSVIVACAV